MDNYAKLKSYKLKALVETTGGLLQIKCEMANDGCIDGLFIDETGHWTRLFYDVNEVRSYLRHSLQIKNVIKMIEVF
jgi:hypothetical protein